jgi:hypothetical protein
MAQTPATVRMTSSWGARCSSISAPSSAMTNGTVRTIFTVIGRRRHRREVPDLAGGYPYVDRRSQAYPRRWPVARSVAWRVGRHSGTGQQRQEPPARWRGWFCICSD